MPGDPLFENFLGRWLAAPGTREPGGREDRPGPSRGVSTLVQGDASQQFRRGLANRISGLKALNEGIDAEDNRQVALVARSEASGSEPPDRSRPDGMTRNGSFPRSI